LVVTNNTFLYKAVANTYLKGRTGASIDNYLVFENRKVEKGTHQPWAIDSLYNTKSIPEAYIKEMDSLQTIAYLIIKNDSIIHEQYWDDYGENSLSGSFSMAKSMVAMLIGVAIDEGKIKSVDQKVSDFLPSFKEGDKAKITIKHLLTMSSGMGFDEHYKNPFSYTAKGYFGTGLEQLTLKQEAISEPGVKWKYLSGNSQLLALIIEAATGDNVSTYLSNKLWKPMGAKNDALWSIDQAEDGVEIAYCCMNSSARDFARFGKLMLGSGKWNGNQLISANYIAQLTSPANILDNRDQPNQKYGYQTWLIPNYKGNNIYYMRGILGQYVICLPEKNMIIVRLGHKRIRPAADKDHPSDLFNYIDMALEMYN
jgi:CubicO group peptidase (beta-lactamase class C family)